MQSGQWMDGIIFCFLCYPYAIHLLLTLAPFILIYSPITTSIHATLFANLRIYHLYISRQSLVNGFPRKDNKLRHKIVELSCLSLRALRGS
jgi:hypothetical protein